MASIASLPSATPAPALSITFNGDSWVEVFAANGRQIEQGLLSSGQQRNYAAGEVGRVKLGNVDAVEVKRGGVVSTWSRSAARMWRALRYPLTVPSRRSPTDPRRGSILPTGGQPVF